MTRFEERLYADWRQTFEVTKIVYERKTEFFELVIFETPGFGRVLALDGIIQVTEGDEFVYHEMLAHVPILAHGRVKDVLIVGGGDGGMLREVLKHPVERAVLVEIDQGVIDMCRDYMPGIPAGAFDDPRTEVVITDGVVYMAETTRTFDVIIIDSTDPIGPGEVLFSEAFYADCAKRLNPGGVVVTQNGVPFVQPAEMRATHRRLSPHFADASFFVAAVPTYVGGFMTLGWGATDPGLRAQPVDVIRSRFATRPFATRYYTPEIHVASFALPRFMQTLLAQG